MPNRRYESDRYNRNSSGSGGYGQRDHSRSERGRGLSQWSRNSRDYNQEHDDYEGRSPQHDNYQFDRDPSSYDQNMSGRGSNARQGRGASGTSNSRSYSDSDSGYNYQASTAQNQNRSSYWNPAQQDTSWGEDGQGINSYRGSDSGTANSPGHYQGHGIDIGPGNRGDWSASRSSKSDYDSQHGMGQGYGNYVGNAQTGYGSYQGTAGSNYGSYEGNRPSKNFGTHTFSDPGSTFYNNNFTGNPNDRSFNDQSGRQSMSSGFGGYYGSSHGSYQGSNAQGTPDRSKQNVNPGFQDSSRSDTSWSSDSNFSRNENFGRNEGASGSDRYEGMATGFSGPFRDSTSTSQSQGMFSGKGPKGYRRSDERIKDDVCYALMMAPHVDASHIEVDVKDGAVTLTGTVEDRKTKRMAEDCIENVQGVSDVHNQLKVQNSILGAIGAVLTGQKDTKAGEMSSSSDTDFTQDLKSRQKNQKS